MDVIGLNKPNIRSKMIAKTKKEKIDIEFWQESIRKSFSHHIKKVKKTKKTGVAILISNLTSFEFTKINARKGGSVSVKGKLDQTEVTLLLLLY